MNIEDLDIPVSEIQFPHIYEHDTRFGSGYGFAVETDRLPAGIVSQLTFGHKRRIRIKSKHPPVVSEVFSRYEELVRVMTLADFRNIKRDRLLHGVPCCAKATLWGAEVNVPHFFNGWMTGLSLNEVVIDVDHLWQRMSEI